MSELRCGTGREGSQVDPPYISVVGDPDDPRVRSALAGIEEEGVPSRVLPPCGPAAASAREGAQASPLEVGIAFVDTGGCLVHAKFPEGIFVDHVEHPDVADARRLGHAAARVVLSVPLNSAVR